MVCNKLSLSSDRLDRRERCVYAHLPSYFQIVVFICCVNNFIEHLHRSFGYFNFTTRSRLRAGASTNSISGVIQTKRLLVRLTVKIIITYVSS